MKNLKLHFVFHIIIIITIFNSLLLAETEPDISFGKYSMEEFKDSVYLNDTTASVVILYEIGEAYFNKFLEIEYKMHRRIKILNEDGYDWGTIRIPFRKSSREEKFQELKGMTAYLDESGQIIKQELDSDDIFEEKVNTYQYIKSFTLPSLKPGCIIEYTYTIRTDYMYNFPERWTFQHSEPALWSEYKTDIPSIYMFAIFTQKTQPFYIDESEQFNRDYTSRDNRQVNLYLSGAKKRLVMKDIPALDEEPYMKSIDNYRSHVIYQLAKYNPPYSSSKEVRQTWESLSKELMDTESFGGVIKNTGAVKDKVKEITAGFPTDDGKLLAIYNYVKDAITWNGRFSKYANDPDDVLKETKGDAADINLLLTTMLRAAGITAYPVILSTTDNGTIYSDYPMLNQFNDVIVYASVNRAELLLDATDKYRPYYLLPSKVLNGYGLLIKDDGYQWAQITPSGRNISVEVASVLIKPDGAIEGLMRITDAEYKALQARKKMVDLKEDEYLKDVLASDETGIIPADIKITDKDVIDNNLVIDANFSSPAYSQVAGDMIYVDPCFLGKIKENPFKKETRSFPVDFFYPIDSIYKVNITLPAGYQLADCPKAVTEKLGEDDAGYVREIGTDGTMLQISTHFYVNKVTFSTKEYQELKKFYDQVVAHEAEMLILQKGN